MHDNWTDYTCSTVTGNCQNVRMKTSRSIEGVTISLRLKNGSLQITNHIDHYHTCSARGRKFSLGEKHLSDTQHFECLFCGHYTHSLFFFNWSVLYAKPFAKLSPTSISCIPGILGWQIKMVNNGSCGTAEAFNAVLIMSHITDIRQELISFRALVTWA